MLNAYSVDDIIITQSGGYDEWNEPLPEVEIEIKGYAEWKTRLVRNVSGEEVTSTIKLYIHKRNLDDKLTQALTHEDRVKSINGSEIDRAIITVHEPKAFSNPHYEVYLA
jgi:hypothetical protein